MPRLALALVVLPVLLPDLGAAQSWKVRAPLQEARQEVAVAELDGGIYVIGGFRADGSVADTVEVYDTNTDACSFAPPLPVSVHHAAAAAVGGRLYVFGGWSDPFLTPLDAVHVFDPGSGEDGAWTAGAPMPAARGALAAAVLDGLVYTAGGSPAAREQDFAVYDPVADEWTELPPMPTPRNHLGLAADVHEVFVPERGARLAAWAAFASLGLLGARRRGTRAAVRARRRPRAPVSATSFETHQVAYPPAAPAEEDSR